MSNGLAFELYTIYKVFKIHMKLILLGFLWGNSPPLTIIAYKCNKSKTKAWDFRVDEL